MKKKKCTERGRIILYENGSLPDDDLDAPGGGNMQEPDDDVDCTLSFDERGSVAGLSDDMDIDINHTEMLEGETQSSHFDPPPEESEELQSEYFGSRAMPARCQSKVRIGEYRKFCGYIHVQYSQDGELLDCVSIFTLSKSQY